LANPVTIERTGLRNAFSRALCKVDPRIGALQRGLDEIQATWALSGAGPCHCVVLRDGSRESPVAELRARFGDWLAFHHVRTIPSGPDQ
jgi:hypothetical protein